MSFVSYAQNYEDVMLRRALRDVRQGFYIDVGAQHPINESVTKAFYEQGWRGINVEPVAAWFTLLEQDRPHDINLNLAVGTERSHLTLFEVAGTGLSTTDPALAQSYREEGREVIERRVKTRPLDDILAEHRVDEVHFMKVDCEGAEKAALQSISLSTVRPWVIVLEAMEPNRQVPTHGQWEDLLTGRGYKLAYRDGLNRFYVAEEHAELINAFDYPPNVFDDFVHARDQVAHQGVNEAHVRLRAALGDLATSQATVAQLAEALRVGSEEQAHWRNDFAERLNSVSAQRGELEAQLTTAQVRIASLEQIKDELDARLRVARTKVATAAEVDQMLRRQHELMRQVEALRLECDLRTQDVHRLMLSTSWRITAPLRAAKELSRGLVRSTWRLVRPLVAHTARACRPVMVWALGHGAPRRVAGLLFGPETRVGRKARAFLYPPKMGEQTTLVMSADARAIESMLRLAIARNAEGQG